jgi:hypothetical protein
MSDAELVIVLCAIVLMIVVTFFGSLRRKRLNRVDYWLLIDQIEAQKRIGPKLGDRGCDLNAIGPDKLCDGNEHSALKLEVAILATLHSSFWIAQT